MAASGWTWTLAALLLIMTQTWAHNHQRASETYQVSAGHLFVLKCSIAGDQSNVSWTKRNQDHRLPPGVEVHERLLWFKPVQPGHHGTYTCHSRRHSEEHQMDIEVSVSSEECPYPSETRALVSRATGRIPCKLNQISNLNTTKHFRWMKGCGPLQRAGQPFSVDDRGQLRLSGATAEDAGTYTCLIDVSIEGRNFTASRSVEVIITNGTVYVDPQVVYPQNYLVEVEMGLSVELKCLADCGYSEDGQTIIYWLVNGTHTDDYPELSHSWEYVYEKQRVSALSTLFISKVHSGFLNVPFICRIVNPVGEHEGQLWLQKADHSAFYFTVALCLTLSLGVLVLAASIFFFKVELVLAYREMMRHFSKYQVPNEKLYDAYVSCLHPHGVTPPEMSSFALQLLPEKLEKQHGYSLYISGRDDCPGEALHDAIAATLQKSLRLIIILSSECNTPSKPEEPLQLLDNYQQRLCYEQRVGLYDALTQKEPCVILVEIGGPVDYSHLPESLRYIRRTQGALRWKAPSRGSTLGRLQSNRNFWKNLKYQMPPVPLGRAQTVV